MSRENDTDSRILVASATIRVKTVHIEKCLMDWKYETIPLECKCCFQKIECDNAATIGEKIYPGNPKTFKTQHAVTWKDA